MAKRVNLFPAGFTQTKNQNEKSIKYKLSKKDCFFTGRALRNFAALLFLLGMITASWLH